MGKLFLTRLFFSGVVGLGALLVTGCSTTHRLQQEHLNVINSLEKEVKNLSTKLDNQADIDSFLKKINLDKIIVTKSMDILGENNIPLKKILSEEFQSCMFPMVEIKNNEINAFNHPLDLATLENEIKAFEHSLELIKDKNVELNLRDENKTTSLFKLNEIFDHDGSIKVEKLKHLIPLKSLIGRLQSSNDDLDVLNYVLTNYLDNYFSAEKSDTSGFISRDGTRYKFSGASTDKNTSLSIDHSQIGADIARIGLEAFRDVFLQLPVIPESTLYKLKYEFKNEEGNKSINKKLEKLTVNIYKEIGNWIYEEKPHEYKVNQKKFNDFQTKANKVESKVATLIGKTIRGGTAGSLNNEALAKAIETSAGVMARHLTERAFWCAEIPHRS